MTAAKPPRPILPDFTPVPRVYRHDGWTAERQRGFIEALADTGNVRAAAARVGKTTEGAYQLRRQRGAESFRRAWEAALAHGVQTLADIAIDRAISGTAEPVYWQGEQVGEKRRYNDRLLMFMLRHHQPARYGPLAPMPPGTRHPDTLAREQRAADRGGRDHAGYDPATYDPADAADVEEMLVDRGRMLAWLAWHHRQKVYEAAAARIAGDTKTDEILGLQLRRLEEAMDGHPKYWGIFAAILPFINRAQLGIESSDPPPDDPPPRPLPTREERGG